MTTEAPPAPASTPAQPATPPAAPATPPPPPPAINPDGTLGENWFLSLGDEFAPHAADLGKHKHIKSLITELDYFRKNGVEYPADPAAADPRAVDRFRKAAGVPEKPDGYGLTPEALNIPAEQFDADLANAIAAKAHALHAPPAVVKGIVDEFNTILGKRLGDQQAAAAKAQKEAQDALVAEWKSDFQQNASTVRHLTTKLAESAGVDPAAVAHLANDPAFARMMLQVSRLTSEDRSVTPPGFGDLRSPAQKIADIQGGRDPQWSPLLNSKNDADRLKVFEHMKTLREQAAQ